MVGWKIQILSSFGGMGGKRKNVSQRVAGRLARVLAVAVVVWELLDGETASLCCVTFRPYLKQIVIANIDGLLVVLNVVRVDYSHFIFGLPWSDYRMPIFFSCPT